MPSTDTVNPKYGLNQASYMDALLKLVSQLDSQSIDYCIIRNYESIIAGTPYDGKDIDIAVKPSDLPNIKKIMRSLSFHQLDICPCSNHLAYVILTKEMLFLSIHYHVGGASGSDGIYYPIDRIMKASHRQKQFNVPKDHAYLALLLLHNFIAKGKLQDKYIERIFSLYKKIDQSSFRESLDGLYSVSLIDGLMSSLDKKDIASLKQAGIGIRQQFKRKSFAKIWRLKACVMFWSFGRLFRSAPLVCFIGMDGTGKTTNTTRLMDTLDKSLIRSRLIYTGRGRDNILPIQFFAGLINKRPKDSGQKDGGISESEGSQKRRKVNISTRILFSLAAPVFAFDLWLRYWVRIWPKRKTHQLVITDRYSSDILLMANVPYLEKKLLYLLFPRPTKTIYLYNKPEVLYARKPDHPSGDLERQEILFARINPILKPVKVLSDDKERVFRKVLAEIDECFMD